MIIVSNEKCPRCSSTNLNQGVCLICAYPTTGDEEIPIPYLTEFKNRFEEIDKSKEPTRTKRLSTLMTDMEQVYRIPILKSGSGTVNPQVMNLYKKVSKARSFEFEEV